jgi:hypothetical protein
MTASNFTMARNELLIEILSARLSDRRCRKRNPWIYCHSNEKVQRNITYKQESMHHRQIARIETIESSDLNQMRKGSGNKLQKFRRSSCVQQSSFRIFTDSSNRDRNLKAHQRTSSIWKNWETKGSSSKYSSFSQAYHWHGITKWTLNDIFQYIN